MHRLNRTVAEAAAVRVDQVVLLAGLEEELRFCSRVSEPARLAEDAVAVEGEAARVVDPADLEDLAGRSRSL